MIACSVGYGRRFGRRKSSNVKKRVVGMAGRAAARRFRGTPMCKDLGALTPKCLATKVRQHATLPAGGTLGSALAMAVGGITTDRYYNNILWCYPYQPFVNYSTVAGYSACSGSAIGWAKLIGTTGATALFKRCCVLNVNMVLTLSFSTEIAENDGKSSPQSITNQPTTLGYHYFHPRSNDESALPNPTSTALNDQTFCQPDVLKKVAGRDMSQVLVYQGDAAATTTSRCNIYPGSRVVWRKTVWPHKVLDIPFSQYVGDENSFGTSSALPTNYACVDVAGFFSSLNGAMSPPENARIECYLTWTLLLKEPWSNVT